MSSRIVSLMLFTLVLAACVQKPHKVVDANQQGELNTQPLSEKCQNAKQDLDKAVQAGDRDNLHELKRNIELYCVWRRY